jgi:hypothetical protein
MDSAYGDNSVETRIAVKAQVESRDNPMIESFLSIARKRKELQN